MSRTILLIAGEASGDERGAELVEALRRLDASLQFAGVGGQRLRQAGMQILVDTASIATMGLVETFGTIGRVVGAYRRLKRFLRQQQPALVVLIDYPEFNLFFAKQAKKLGIPVFYYISPQVWAWRSGRVRKIAQRVDRLGVVFPFEEQLYNFNGRTLANFVGHPLLDVVHATCSREDTCRRHGLDPNRPLLAILPGSREKEIRALLPAAMEAARLLRAEGWQAAIALAHTLTVDDVRAALDGKAPKIPTIPDDTYNLVNAADAAFVASGTATLETALLGRPMVIMYRVSPFTFALARRLVRVGYIGMPNIILERRVFPELLQNDVTPEKLVAALHDVRARQNEMTAALRELRNKLGEPGAAERAARLVLDLLNRKAQTGDAGRETGEKVTDQ
ncbi:MAG: lipid-A-disaccharide synthase [Deltaproteobacteria bacterium]|nr:lipid-A-disaccharide synthase [Deltaproteobacteria bacterium]